MKRAVIISLIICVGLQLAGCNAQHAGGDIRQTGAEADLQARNAALAQANAELRLEIIRIQETRQDAQAGGDVNQTTVDPELLLTIRWSVYSLSGALCFAALCMAAASCYRAKQDRLLNGDDCRENVDLVKAARLTWEPNPQ